MHEESVCLVHSWMCCTMGALVGAANNQGSNKATTGIDKLQERKKEGEAHQAVSASLDQATAGLL